MNNTTQYGTLTRRPSAWQFVVNELSVILLCLASLGVSGMDDAPLHSMLLWAALAIMLCLGYRFLYLRRTVFTITAGQIIHEHGILHRTHDYIELYRVVDFSEDCTLLQQLFGIKTVKVYSGDRTTPCLRMTGMEADDNLIPVIRERMNHNRKLHGIYEITNR